MRNIIYRSVIVFLFLAFLLTLSVRAQNRRPLIEKDCTGGITHIDSVLLDNTMPVRALDDLTNTAPSVYRGYIRGGRKYHTKTLVDGVDVSDTYFAGGTGGRLIVESYSGLNRSNKDDLYMTGINQSGIRSVGIRSGLADSEFNPAAGGIIDVRTKNGGGRYSGKLFYRSSTGGLRHKGPYIYSDKDLYFAERIAKLNNPNTETYGELYNWNEGKYRYGEGRTTEFEASFSGPLTGKGGFFLTGRYYNSYGSLPGEFNRAITSSLKLHYNLSDNMKLTAYGVVDDGGQLTGFTTQNFNLRYKYFMEGVPRDKKLGLFGYVSLRHESDPGHLNGLSWELKLSKTYRRTETGFIDADGDGWIDYGEDGSDFLILSSSKDVDKYFYRTQEAAFFKTNYWGNTYYQSAFSYGIYRISGAGYYYEDLRRGATTAQFNLTQTGKNHTFKTGFSYKYHTLSQVKHKSQTGSFDPDIPWEPTHNRVHPVETGMYFQDCIEFKGALITPGLRIEGYKPGGRQYDDLFDAATLTDNEDGQKVRLENRGKNLKTVWNLLPRLGVSHPISENAAMFYSVRKSVQAPAFGYLFDEYGTLANPSLPHGNDIEWKQPEAIEYEMGMQFAFRENYMFDISAYYRDLSNYGTASYQFNEEEGYLYYFDTSWGFAVSRGIEASLTKRPGGRLSGRISYAYSYIKESVLAGSISLDEIKNKTAFTADQAFSLEDRVYWNSYMQNVLGGNDPLTGGYDREHRISAVARLELPLGMSVTSIANAESGFYYNKTATTENHRRRVYGTAPWNIRTDMRITKRIPLKHVMQVSAFLEVRNLFKKPNIIAFCNSGFIPD